MNKERIFKNLEKEYLKTGNIEDIQEQLYDLLATLGKVSQEFAYEVLTSDKGDKEKIETLKEYLKRRL